VTGRPAPRLILDIQATQSHAHHDRGIARFVKEQARLLMRRGQVAALLLNPHLRFPLNADQELLTSPLLRWNTATELRRIVEEADGDLAYYVMSPFESSQWATADLATHALRSQLPIITTLYDLIPLLHPEQYLTNPSEAKRYRTRQEFLQRADLVLSISEHTRSDAVAHLGIDPGRIVNIGAGVSPFFTPAVAGEDTGALLRRELPALHGSFVLTLTGQDRRKNTERLLEAWARVPADVRAGRQLVVSCRVDPAGRQAWLDHATAAGLAPADVVFTDWITDEVLRALYRTADLFVFPPLYEGFGLPAAEAIACGCPVVTSSTSSLPEILCWPDATFDPTDTDDMAATIERALADGSFRRALLDRGAARRPELTWDAVVDRTTAAVSGHLAGPDGRTRVAPRPTADQPVHLAVVGPMPPAWSGIADYNARLLPALAARCHLDVFTPHPRPTALVDLDVGWFSTRAFGQVLNPYAYDAVLYTIGNSDDHHDLYELALEFPGILWMHDVRLPGLYVTYAQQRVPKPHGRDFLEERVRRQYRRRTPFVPGPIEDEVTTHYIGAGLGLTKELVDTMRGVVVSSELASRLLHLDQGPDAGRTPTWVVPLGAPTTTPSARRAAGRSPVVLSLGMVAPSKGAELLVRALPAMVAQAPGARLVFVGPVGDGYRRELQALAASLGVADRVEITGHVAADAYADHLATATCAVQLRLSTNGESSAAVLDALAAGLPVVTNVAATAELPEGTVELIGHDVGAGELGHHLGRLVTDADRLAALSEAGSRYASSWGLDEVAEAVLGIVAELQASPASSRPPA
jgi:glycosyltransferase involved in cell wall biosynthesis